MSSRRKRSDSTEALIEAAQLAANKIEPPAYLNLPENVRHIWDDIISTRAASSWTPNDLIQAATLARVYFDIQRYSDIVDRTSRMTKDDAGAYKPNAVHKILVDLVAQAQSLSRSLQVHARATQGESRDQVKRNQLYSNIRTATHIDDDLLAKPTH